MFLLAACSSDKENNQRSKTKQVPKTVKEFVPEWAKKAIWYQVFPERFRDGDPSNNPKVTDLIGADPKKLPTAWNIHPWGSDWYKLQPYEQQNAANGDDLSMHILRRRYGGDLQGIIDKLDYLQELGITAIYLNPIFQSPSLHKYDGESYHHIEPTFGPDPEGDRALMATEKPIDPSTWVWTKADELALKLIEEAHKRNMRIIFDGVFNHLGINSFAFQDVMKNQEKSVYKDWFIIKSFDDPATADVSEFDYEGWFGVKTLPELREDENGIVEGPKKYIFEATKRWMNPKNKGTEFGIDGWRLDVAFCVAHPFWKDFRKHVRAINPEAYMTAEIVDTPEKVKPYMKGDEFDGEMNYNFAFACAEFFFNPDSMRISVSEFNQRLQQLRELYPKGVAYASQNLFGSHDSNRIGSHIVNRGMANFRDWGKYFQASQIEKNPNYQVRKPNATEIELQKLFAIMQMTYVGAPMIYYGDEVGMWGANDPDCRKPMIWSDINYENEVYNPDGSKRSPDKVMVNQSLFDHYQKLISIRKQYPALQLGEFTPQIVDDENDIFMFERAYQGQRIWVMINNSDIEADIGLPNPGKIGLVDVFNNTKYPAINPKHDIIVPKKSGAILVIQ